MKYPKQMYVMHLFTAHLPYISATPSLCSDSEGVPVGQCLGPAQCLAAGGTLQFVAQGCPYFSL